MSGPADPDLYKALLERRSVRRYAKRPVEPEKLKAVSDLVAGLDLLATEYAGFWRRFAAAIIDWLIMAPINFLVQLPLGISPFSSGLEPDATVDDLISYMSRVGIASVVTTVLADGTCYWRVRAVDAAANTSGWSPVWVLTVQ